MAMQLKQNFIKLKPVFFKKTRNKLESHFILFTALDNSAELWFSQVFYNWLVFNEGPSKQKFWKSERGNLPQKIKLSLGILRVGNESVLNFKTRLSLMQFLEFIDFANQIGVDDAFIFSRDDAEQYIKDALIKDYNHKKIKIYAVISNGVLYTTQMVLVEMKLAKNWGLGGIDKIGKVFFSLANRVKSLVKLQCFMLLNFYVILLNRLLFFIKYRISYTEMLRNNKKN